MIVIELPPEIEHHLELIRPTLYRKALEAIALEGYRQGALSHGQVGRILEMDYEETEGFLQQHDANLLYDKEDLQMDREALDRLFSQ